MTEIETAYAGPAKELSDRVLALISKNPQILKMVSAWDLFKVPGLRCNGLRLSELQAGWALTDAKRRWRTGSP